ncbi:MAG: AAA family ATPase, partial [Nitrospirota bacterium]|nr:AAA family ATPase [Nitrospirota bacterium]
MTEGGNPYVGLRPFSPEDSLYFFGRHEQTGELLRQLSGNRFLAVVGSSGCGKSSLLRAGLIPALEGGFLVEERDRWQMTQMRPGDGPFRALAEGLLDLEDITAIEAKSPPSLQPNRDALNRLIEELRESSAEGVIDVLRDRLDARSSYLLIVDQFEEIFRFRGRDSDENSPSLSRDALLEQARRREEAEDFVELLLSLSAQEDLPVYVVLSMRSDFLGDCDVFFGLPEAMNRSRFLVPRLTRQQMRQAIEGPARLVGATLAPKLVDRVLNELGDRTDHLPVLQHALMRTFEKWLGTGAIGEISSQAYEQAGGLENALSLHAEEAIVEEDVAITKRLFQCLTDTDSQGRRIRRPCRLDELVAICEVDNGILLKIIARFNADKRNFLVVTDQREGNPRIDISHESLIRVWKRLRDWAQEEADSAVIYRRLADTARRYTPIHAVLQDPELQTTLDWYDTHQPTPAWAQSYDLDFELAKDFLLRSQAHRDSEVAAVAAQKRRKKLAFVGVLTLLVFIGMAVGYQRLENLRNQEALIKAEEGIQEASMLAREGEHQQAVTRLSESRQIFARQKKVPQEIRAMRLQAFNLSHAGSENKARELLHEALELAKQEHNPQLMGEIVAATAMLEDDVGNDDLAFQDYQEALDLFEKSGDTQEQGRMLERLALNRQNAKLFDEAAIRYQEALGAYQSAGDTLGERRIERQLSDVTPWGFLTNLRTGTLTPMRGFEAVFRVGRGPSNNLSVETTDL